MTEPEIAASDLVAEAEREVSAIGGVSASNALRARLTARAAASLAADPRYAAPAPLTAADRDILERAGCGGIALERYADLRAQDVDEPNTADLGVVECLAMCGWPDTQIRTMLGNRDRLN